MLTGIKTRIRTDRFEDTLRFYSDFLGLELLGEWSDEEDIGAILGLPDAGSGGYLEIAAAPEVVTPAIVSLQFRTDDLDGFVSELAGNVDHSEPETKAWGSTYITMTDPAGNLVIVFEGDM